MRTLADDHPAGRPPVGAALVSVAWACRLMTPLRAATRSCNKTEICVVIYYICVLILLYMCPHTDAGTSKLEYMLQYVCAMYTMYTHACTKRYNFVQISTNNQTSQCTHTCKVLFPSCWFNGPLSEAIAREWRDIYIVWWVAEYASIFQCTQT